MKKQKNIPKRFSFFGLFVSAVFLLSFLAIRPAQPVIAEGEGDEVLYLPFDRLVNNKWEDRSGYNNDGINHGASCASWGKVGKCAYFDGENNDYIDFVTDSSLRLDTSDFTIATWVLLFKINGKNCIFHSAGRDDGAYDDGESVFLSTQKNTGGKLKLGFYAGKGLSSFTIPYETWTHVAVTYQRSNKRADFYKNGDWKNNVTMDFNPDFSLFEGANVGRCKWDGQYLDGGLDELRIYKRKLSEPEVKQLWSGDPLYKGYVKDQEGQPIPGATVTCLNWRTGQIVASTTTESNGYYEFLVPMLDRPWMLYKVKASETFHKSETQFQNAQRFKTYWMYFTLRELYYGYFYVFDYLTYLNDREYSYTNTADDVNTVADFTNVIHVWYTAPDTYIEHIVDNTDLMMIVELDANDLSSSHVENEINAFYNKISNGSRILAFYIDEPSNPKNNHPPNEVVDRVQNWCTYVHYKTDQIYGEPIETLVVFSKEHDYGPDKPFENDFPSNLNITGIKPYPLLDMGSSANDIDTRLENIVPDSYSWATLWNKDIILVGQAFGMVNESDWDLVDEERQMPYPQNYLTYVDLALTDPLTIGILWFYYPKSRATNEVWDKHQDISDDIF